MTSVDDEILTHAATIQAHSTFGIAKGLGQLVRISRGVPLIEYAVTIALKPSESTYQQIRAVTKCWINSLKTAELQCYC